MSELTHNGKTITQVRGTNSSEYKLYLSLADNGHGVDFTTGKPLKSYYEWLNS
jgi:hypothetical protein